MNQQPLPLDDIILPAAVSYWPLAWGWWLAIVTAITLILGLSFWLVKHLHYKRHLKDATEALEHTTDSLQGAELFIAVNTWLKTQAAAAFPQAQSLYGDAWIEFLNSSAGKVLFIDEQALALSQGIYQPIRINCDANALKKNALLWLTLSRALKGGREC